MGWRTVTVESACKLSYKNGYMLIMGEKDISVYLPEIDTLIISTTQFQITGVLISELIKNKTNVVFCDEKHNPCCNFLPFYGCYNSSKKITEQIGWDNNVKQRVFTAIIKQKIINQSKVLLGFGKQKESEMLKCYADEIKLADITNREGFSAKVYFNALFGLDFTRGDLNAINSALDYGYTILLSCFNREIASCGYLTQLGIGHKNEFNQFNLSCDLIEPFRVLVDSFVVKNPPKIFDTDYKKKLITLTIQKVFYGKEYFFTDAISLYVRNVTTVLKSGEIEKIYIYEF